LPIFGNSVDCLGGKLSIFEIPKFLKIFLNLSSTLFARVPTNYNFSSSDDSINGIKAFKAPSSPWVKVVSIPLPE